MAMQGMLGDLIGAKSPTAAPSQDATGLWAEDRDAVGALEPGMVEAGNVDLYAQPIVQNPDGTSSTVDSMGFEEDGLHYLLPSVTPDGRHLSDTAMVFAAFKRTNRHLGIFKTREASDTYGAKLHEDYARGRYATSPIPSKTLDPQMATKATPGRVTGRVRW